MRAFRNGPTRWLFWVAGSSLSLQILTGCYTYAPLDGSLALPTNRDVSVELTDRGRYELNGAIGQSPSRIEGRLLAATDSTLTMSVRSVQSLTGQSSTWAGESLLVRRTGIGAVRERKFSRSRTVALTAALLGGVALIALTVGLDILSFGGDGGSGDSGGGGGNET